ncbi:MAG: MMPL family transporter, partial [Pseudomonadota bacterium]
MNNKLPLPIRFALDRPMAIIASMLTVTVLLGVMAAVPNFLPAGSSPLPVLRVDTDPENMLPHDEPVRVFHQQMKQTFQLHDLLVVGIVDETHPDGVFNPQSLRNIYDLAEFAKTLHWPSEQDSAARIGVIEVDLLAPSTLDNIEQDGLGTVRFEWLMSQPPDSAQQARQVRDKALNLPFLRQTVVSENGLALCLYLPLTSKDISYRVYSRLQEKIATFKGGERYLITGLPVAEDAFGVEMFIQMAICAPLAMLIIFLLMWFFFRKPVLIVAPMVIALASVMITMSLLVVSGHTVHIMSSMIPIFIMPIAVLDSIHILSRFFDRYPLAKDRRDAITAVMSDLHTPMLYTSLTTAAGFASLALIPIPPVQVFGLFVAMGVMSAWFLTITFIPAYIVRMHENSLQYMRQRLGADPVIRGRLMTRVLRWLGHGTYRWSKPVLLMTLVALGVAAIGIGRIQINDNPVRWFSETHPIRVADEVLNQRFGGTYMAYLALSAGAQKTVADAGLELTERILQQRNELAVRLPQVNRVFDALVEELSRVTQTGATHSALLKALEAFIAGGLDQEGSASDFEAWEAAELLVEQERGREQIFKQPQTLRYIDGLQRHLLRSGVVGKSNSITDIVKTVHRELHRGHADQFRVPDSAPAIAQTLMTYQNSHRPQDLWHFVTHDYRQAALWIQMKSGNNVDMSRVVAEVDRYWRDNPPPFSLQHRWFGLTYINMLWQERMVNGMLVAFLGSFLVVLLMMLVLLRSLLWALLGMVPLMVTIVFIYGVIGLVGKDYDMPVAVLSALSLGLAVDFAIHFLVAIRDRMGRGESWRDTIEAVFGAPARAITRNGLVISLGFLPLLIAPLVPYQTVGVLIASIMLASSVATLILLPALIRLLEPWLFRDKRQSSVMLDGATWSAGYLVVLALVALNLFHFWNMAWDTSAW